MLEVELFSSGTTTAQSGPTGSQMPGKPVEKFNNYSSNVECCHTDRATFTLNEPI